jgi:RimK family alpha-L-glutamate ligase
MQVPKFREYITEQNKERKDKPITVAILTKASPKVNKQKSGNVPEKELTVGLIEKACQKKGFKCIIINTRRAIITGKDEEKNTLTVYNYDGKDSEHTFVGKDTVCFTRAGSVEDEAGLSLISAFQNSQAFMVNTRSAMLTCDNKLTSALLFEKFGIPTPRTAFVSNEKNIEDALELVGGKFPIILKTLTGTQGIGVIKIGSLDSLTSTIQALWKHDAELLLQEYMPADGDIRTLVVDNKIFASTNRVHAKGEFRSNTHRGAVPKPYKLNEEEQEIILKASRASKAYLVGVDHIVYKGKPYILEINGSPGSGAEYEGYQYIDYYADPKPSGSINGEKLMYNIIDWVSKRSHWDRQASSECGWLETVELTDVGKVRAKFDSGNGSKACALHADEILESKGKIVKWKYNGKTFTKPKKGVSKVFRANADGQEPSEVRPTVLVDILFNGFTYKDVEVGLDSRPRSGSDLLINRDLMRLMNISVNPNRTFALSKRLRPVDKKGKEDKVGFEKK